jgi:acyl dehydratase
MVEDASGIDKLKGKVGEEWAAGTYEIEPGMIKRFVQAIGDSNPLWQNEDYAQKTKYGCTIAPPTFIVTMGLDQIEPLLTSAHSTTLLHASTELECYQPVMAGDSISVTIKLADIRERRSQTGRTAFVTFALTYRNQRQELVARCRQMLITY